MEIRILDITEDSVVDGLGLRTVVWCSGCQHHCKGCHNPETWDFKNGYDITVEELAEKLNTYNKITFSGGDPMYQAEALDELIGLLKPEMDIWIYTGFNISDFNILFEKMSNLQSRSFVVKCGPFVENLKDPRCLFRGSSNQKIYQWYAKTSIFSDISDGIDGGGATDNE